VSDIELRIEKLVYGGDGLARHEGRVVLTPFVLPDETVRAEVTRAGNDLLRGRLLNVITPSPERIEPRCPYFQRCGGCHYQHTGYEYQLAQKRAILLEVLRRIGGIGYAGDIVTVAGDPWHYRNRVQLHIGAGQIGYFEAGSHALVAVDHCPIASPKLNDCIAALSREVARLRPFEATLELFTNESDVQFNLRDRVPQPFVALLRSIAVTTPIEHGGLRVSRDTFFQVNRFLTGPLVEAAIGGVTGDWALDLYAGAGLFTLPLSRRFARVTAVDDSISACRDLEHNAGAAAILNSLETHQAAADAFLLTVTTPPDFILADPPRTGIGKLGVKELIRVRAPRLTIVSCDPATLARDLKPLLAAGYTIAALTLIDLFPQTAHFETVAELRL